MMSNPQNSEKSEWPTTLFVVSPGSFLVAWLGVFHVSWPIWNHVKSEWTRPNHGTMEPVSQSLGDDHNRLPSDKQTCCFGKSPCLTGKSTISMAIFNSYVCLPEGNRELNIGFPLWDDHIVALQPVWCLATWRICHPEEQLEGILMMVFCTPTFIGYDLHATYCIILPPINIVYNVHWKECTPRSNVLSCFVIMFPVIRTIQGYIPHWPTLIWTKQFLPLWDESQIGWVTRVSVSLNEDDDDIPKIWFTLKYHHLPVC